jgi:Tol biopolymer transport system component
MELNTSGNERDPWVSPDGKHIFFTSTPQNVLTIMEATR